MSVDRIPILTPRGHLQSMWADRLWKIELRGLKRAYDRVLLAECEIPWRQTRMLIQGQAVFGRLKPVTAITAINDAELFFELWNAKMLNWLGKTNW